jgi:hypothetical protein
LHLAHQEKEGEKGAQPLRPQEKEREKGPLRQQE